MLRLEMSLKNETKTCYRFERQDGGEYITLYLKKADVNNAGIDTTNGITVTIEEGKGSDGK